MNEHRMCAVCTIFGNFRIDKRSDDATRESIFRPFGNLVPDTALYIMVKCGNWADKLYACGVSTITNLLIIIIIRYGVLRLNNIMVHDCLVINRK